MSSPKVQYGYADGSNNTVRPVSMTYPSGRVLTFDYGTPGGINDACSRVEKIVDEGGTVVARYEYLGAGTPVTVHYTEPDLKYTLASLDGSVDPDTGDIYTGLDRFGRVKDCRWHNLGTSEDAARIQYGYDRASNRTWRNDPVAQGYGKGFDELYSYDSLHRLKEMQRGTLNPSKTAITGGTFAECWSLDPTGNWKGYRRDDDGVSSWDLVQQRTANPVNEISKIDNLLGPAWAQPAYDPAGNMTTIPQPKDPTKEFTATYDAWNRLTKLEEDDCEEGLQTVAEYQYDARRFRTVQKNYEAGTLTETRHHYYNSGWQNLEERLGTAPDAADPDRQFVWGQRYIDDLILRDRDTDVEGTLDERLYSLQDGNWNVISIADTSGGVQERYAYSAYGSCGTLSPWFGVSSDNISWTETFSGYHQCPASRLYTARFRLLVSHLGIWNRRDPIATSHLTMSSRYIYANSRPAVFTDPLGLDVYLEGYGGSSSIGGGLSSLLCSACNAWHQRIGVDTWDESGKYQKRRYFSYRQTGYNIPLPRSSWLGRPSLQCCVYSGTVYEDTTKDPYVLERMKKTTIEEDRRILSRLVSMVNQQDGYSLLRHSCRTFSQSEFENVIGTEADAVISDDTASHHSHDAGSAKRYLPKPGDKPIEGGTYSGYITDTSGHVRAYQ